MAPKGISNRTLLAKQKGIRMGQTIMVAYRDDGKQDKKIYEGILSDRRIGGTDRESYLELKRCLLLGANSEIIAMEGNKRFVDAFIDDMDVTDPRNEAEIAQFLNAAPPAGAAAPDMGAMGGMMGMAGMPGMGMMGMGMPGMGAMPMMGMNPMMMGMGGMSPMMMGMGGMNPMMMGMNPMMGMGGMGGMGMNPMMAMGMSMMGNQGDAGGACGSSFGPSGDGGSGNGADAGSHGNGAGAAGGGGSERAASAPLPPLVEEPAMSPQELAAAVEAVEDGVRLEVTYTHPQLGKTTYRGILREKFIGASHVQSYMDVAGCQRIGRRGHLREVEPVKRLMLAFVDGVRELPAEDAEPPGPPPAPPGEGGEAAPPAAKRRSRSRSRDRGSR